ncbi:MAG: hypothetical protein LBH77_05650 [Tannerella sp.]|nr:hypothetical protein [Tannerella sp.]
MKRLSTYKVLITGLLTVLFLFPHVVKSTHILLRHKHTCQTHNCHTDEPAHDSTTCPVCKFLLPCFTETKPSVEIETPQRPNIRPFTGYNEDIRISFFTSHSSRAPPPFSC